MRTTRKTIGAETKTCTRCREVLPTSQFFRNRQNADGLLPHCKECQNKATHAHYRANKPKVSALQARWRHENPLADRCHKAVRRALRKGTLVRQPCQCGSMYGEAHHPDYSKPLEVVWMCRSCHKQHHALTH